MRSDWTGGKPQPVDPDIDCGPVPAQVVLNTMERIDQRLSAIQEWQASIEKHLLTPKPQVDATDLKLRGECITTAIHMNKGLSVDLAIIEAEKLYQFLKGQHLAHGNKVH